MSSSSRSDAELQRRVRQQEALAGLGRRALDADELERVMHDAVTAVTETLDVDYCEVFELGPEGERFTLREGAGWSEGEVDPVTIPAETDSQTGYTLHAEGAVVVESLSGEERFDGDDFLVERGVVSGITVTVGPATDPWGVLGAHATDQREFCDGDATFVRNVANVVGSVVERAETHSRLEEVYGRISDGFFALDEQWRFTYLNERANELINPEGRDLIGEEVWDRFPEATDRAFKPNYERAMYEQETVTFEEYYPDPIDAWFEVRAYPSESGLSVYFRESTERKERERRIAEQEQRLSTLMSNVPGMVYRCRNERGWPMEFVSDGSRDLTGYDPAALERGEVSFGEDVVVEEDRGGLWEEIQEGLADDGQYLVTYRIETADGEIRWVRERGRLTEGVGDTTGLEGVVIDVTEEVRAERRLAEERDMFAEGPAIVFRWRNEEGWPVEYVSENVTDILGYEPSALESGEVPYTDLLLDEEIDRIAAEVEAHTDGQTDRFSHEPYRVRTSDGDVRWVKDTTKIVRDDAGEVDHYLGYLVDITERKEREQELRRYETIVETIDDGIYVKDEDGKFTMVNDAYAEMLGYDPEELVGEHASLVVDEEVVERARREETADRDEQLDGPALEAEMETADGERLPAEATFAVLETDDGAQQRVGVVRDTSERKERERELRRYEAIFQAVNDGLYVVDEDGEFTMVNDAYAEMLGYEPTELVGEQVSMVVDESIQEQAREQEAALREGTTEMASIEAEMEAADGERIPAEATFAMLPTPGAEQRRVGVVRDISERKERERELQRYERLVENLPVGVYRNTPEPGGEFVEMNDALARIFGADSREELMEVPVRDLYTDPSKREELSERLEAEGIVKDFELRQETLDGREIWISVTGITTEEDGELYFDGVVQDVTDRKERERELRETERRFEAVFEDPNILVGLLEPDGTVVDINETAMEYIDADLADVRGDLFWETPWWGMGDDVQSDVREWTERAAAGEYVDFQADLTRPDGQQYTLEGYFRPVTDEDGNVVSIIVSDRDVTERREYERRLAQSEQRYRTLAEYFPNGIVTLFDDDLEYTLAAGQGFDWIPVDPEDLEGERLYDVWPEETAEALEPAFQAALDGREEAVELEYEGRDWVLRGVPISDERGDVFAGMTMAQDITERKERERALRESERRYRTLAEHFPNGAVGVYDDDLEYTLAAGAKMGTELPPADVLEGSRLPDVFPEHTVADLEPLFRAAVEEGETGNTTTEFGGRYWRVWATPLRNVDGEIFAGLSFAQDITERREYEQMLEESNERLEQFAYAASHDLQEPLRMVSSYLQLIERRYEDELDEEGEEFIAYAVDGADRMREMIDGLLQYSRVETRGDPFEPVALDAVVAEAREDLGMKIAETNAEIAVADLPQVEGDPGQLRQVFQNLLDNAIEYSGEGRPRVEVSAERAGDWWEISVSDEGIGIDPDDADRAFEVFQSLHDRSSYDGTGIGLALCERVIERHGGDIWVDSRPGEGATFSFTLPAPEDENE
ncbi:PAS domain S-box protein [Halosimplex sp. J119]